jgi:dihydroorotase
MGLPPAVIAVGAPAELMLFDPDAETTFTPEFMKSKSQNTPFLNQTLRGRVDVVLLGETLLLCRDAHSQAKA